METVLHLLARDHGILSYGLIFLIGFLESVFPPVPGDTAIIFSVVLVKRHVLTFGGVLLSVSLGGATGFFLIYYLTARWGKNWALQQRWLHFDEKRLEKTDQLFQRYGGFLILGNRFFSGFRTAIALAAGLSSINVWKMLVLSFFGVLIWNCGLLYVGTTVYTNYKLLLQKIRTYNQGMAIVLVALIALGLGLYLWKRKRRA